MKIFGHRGAKGLAPENTLAAIEAGIKAGVDAVEVDVRVTKDGVPVLWHDPCLLDYKIETATFDELKKIKPDLASLEQALQTIKRRVAVKLDVKPKAPVGPIVTLLQKKLAAGWQASDFWLGSFSQHTLLELHKALPEINTIVIERWSGVRASWRARQLGTKHVCMNYCWMWWGFIRSMAKSDYKLSVYTLNDPAKAKAWERYGLWGVDTDFPDRFSK